MRHIKFLVVHCSGAPRGSIDTVRRTHVQGNGWLDIGYHYVIHLDGSLHVGRPEYRPGAHVQGLNLPSIGICCIGDGDAQDFNPEQYATLINLLISLKLKFPQAEILGHRETPPFVKPSERTRKTCPGKKVSMDEIRAKVEAWQNPAANSP